MAAQRDWQLFCRWNVTIWETILLGHLGNIFNYDLRAKNGWVGERFLLQGLMGQRLGRSITIMSLRRAIYDGDGTNLSMGSSRWVFSGLCSPESYFLFLDQDGRTEGILEHRTVMDFFPAYLYHCMSY